MLPAQELGQNIDINYFYGGQFYGDANITSRMEGPGHSNGTQAVLACRRRYLHLRC